MKVSLIMPLFNNAAFVKRAVDSVLAQTHKDWELIIVDDGSTDGSYELVGALYKQPEIKILKNDQNQGIGITRKKAVDVSDGELIGHIDSDDMLERWALEEMIECFKKKPDVGLIYSDFAQINRKDEVEIYAQSKTYDAKKLYQHGWRHFGMYRKSAYIKTSGFNTQLNRCEDGDLFMQIAEQMPCYHLPKVLYFYRNHGDNTTSVEKKCEECNERPICNYIRVWGKAAGIDHITFKRI